MHWAATSSTRARGSCRWHGENASPRRIHGELGGDDEQEDGEGALQSGDGQGMGEARPEGSKQGAWDGDAEEGREVDEADGMRSCTHVSVLEGIADSTCHGDGEPDGRRGAHRSMHPCSERELIGDRERAAADSDQGGDDANASACGENLGPRRSPRLSLDFIRGTGAKHPQANSDEEDDESSAEQGGGQRRRDETAGEASRQHTGGDEPDETPVDRAMPMVGEGARCRGETDGRQRGADGGEHGKVRRHAVEVVKKEQRRHHDDASPDPEHTREEPGDAPEERRE